MVRSSLGLAVPQLFARFDFHDLSTPIHGFLIGAGRARAGAPNDLLNAHMYPSYPLLGIRALGRKWLLTVGNGPVVAAHCRNDGCRKGCFVKTLTMMRSPPMSLPPNSGLWIYNLAGTGTLCSITT